LKKFYRVPRGEHPRRAGTGLADFVRESWMPTAVMVTAESETASVRRSILRPAARTPKTVIIKNGSTMTRQPHICCRRTRQLHPAHGMESGLSLTGFRVSFGPAGAGALGRRPPTEEFDAVIRGTFTCPTVMGFTLVPGMRALFSGPGRSFDDRPRLVELAVRAGRAKKRCHGFSSPNH